MQAISFFATGIGFAQLKIHKIGYSKAFAAGGIIALAIGTIWVQSSMLRVTWENCFPYYLVATAVSGSLIVVFWDVPDAGVWSWIRKIGARTIDILIWHFLALKLVSLVKIWHYGLPIERLADFPVINGTSHPDADWYWLLYALVGVSLPLALSVTLDRIAPRWSRYLRRL